MTQQQPHDDAARPTLFVFIAIMLVAVNLRAAIMGFVPVLDAVGAALGFGAAAVGVVATIPTAVFGLTAFVAPWLYARLRGETLLALASLVTCVALVARSLAVDVWQLGAAFAVAIAGMGVANVVLVPIAKQYYAQRLGFINGAYLGVMQISPIAAPIAAAALIEAGVDWRIATGFWAITAALAAGAWAVQGRLTRRAERADADAAQPHPADAQPADATSSPEETEPPSRS